MLEPKIRGKRRAGMYVNVPAPKREIKVQNDTVPNYNGFVAYYTSDYNSITNNIKIGNGPDSQLNLQTIMTHEQKHKDNANEGEKGIEGYWMSLEQYYKLCRYNEISANIAEVLYLREEYIQAKTDEEREQIAKTRDGEFSFYFDAIKRGEIDPFTSDPEKFMEEMKFIAQGTQKMWMENHLDFYNENQLPGQVLAYYNRIDNIFVTDRDFYPNEGNYIFAKHIAFGTNLGGIDFTPFIEELDFVPSAIKEADKMIQEGKSADEVRHVLSKEFKEDFKKFENMEYSLSFRQFAALQNVKCLLGDFMSLRTMLIDNETFRESLRGVSDKEIAKRYETLGEARVKYLQAIASGKIKLNPQGIDKTEEEFIGSLIQHCPNISMWHSIIEEWLVGREKYGEVSRIEQNKNFNYLMREALMIKGIDFSPYLKEVEIDAVYAKLDEEFDNGNGLGLTFGEIIEKCWASIKHIFQGFGDEEQESNKFNKNCDKAVDIWFNDMETEGRLISISVPMDEKSEVGYSKTSSGSSPFRKPGDPKWKKWSEEQRVSEPYKVEIIDLSSDYLWEYFCEIGGDKYLFERLSNLIDNNKNEEWKNDIHVQETDNLRVVNPQREFMEEELRRQAHLNQVRMNVTEMTLEQSVSKEEVQQTSGKTGGINVKPVVNLPGEVGLPDSYSPGRINQQNFKRNWNNHWNNHKGRK